MPFQKAGNFFPLPFSSQLLLTCLCEIHGSRVLGQQQHFHLQSRINICPKVSKTWAQIILFFHMIMDLGFLWVFLVWLIKNKSKN